MTRWTMLAGGMVGVLLVGLVGQSAMARQETLTNDAIVALVKADLGTGTVIAKIKSSNTAFDVSTKGLIDLKSRSVPDEVIQAMVEAAATKPVVAAADPASGEAQLFLLRTGPASEVIRQPVEAAIARQRFAVGIFSAGTQVVIPGKNAALQVQEPRPSFVFRFPDESGAASRYILTRLGPSDEGNGRKIDLDVAVRFDTEKLGPREFKVTVAADLRRGEYCFYDAAQLKEGWPGQAASVLVYDFGIAGARR